MTPLGVFGLCLVAALVVRVAVLQDMSSAVLSCRWCATPAVIKADVPYLVALALLFAVSTLRPVRWWTLLWRVPAVMGFWLYVLDIATMVQFNSRFMIADARIYLADAELAVSVLDQAPLSVAIACTLLVALSGWWWIRISPQHALSRRFGLTGAALMLSVAGLALLLPTPGYVHQWALENVLAANWPTGIDERYGAQTLGHLQTDPAPYYCTSTPAHRDNVVVLVLESWSPYHSQRWSGLNDWTPRLDRLAGEGTWFSRLHAGGSTTNDGLVSLLTGRQLVLPFTPPTQTEAFEGAWRRAEQALPHALAARGYKRSFLTSGDLSFTHKGEWLSHIGFDTLQGHDTPAFDGLARHHFNAVEDAALYEHALSFLRQRQRSPHPQFVVIENVSTHHPFVHPDTHERSEEQVFRYMDDTAADFIEALKRDGFFGNGLLVVVSDHRAMTMMSREEHALLGRAAASNVPGFILTGEKGVGEVSGLYHQADLMPTLLAHVSEPPYCHQSPPRSLLNPDDTSPACVFHARGDQRDLVNVFCPQGQGVIRVDGDDSRFVRASMLSRPLKRDLLQRLARERQ
ncbi:LTA synthase family protein [Halomonas sp. PAMB 3232]|uniref:LTA synthase family protein n=1 Tax=Halomonas sp. PAMB 3232 TaxID=3075221 RepID=UPI00289D17DB|nr:LTA synthase family protein [Halomonas sp. PAMB 3232]WNL40142.1 LTA synthase family protein [Halomonas sp. PAMB 3232]